MSNLRVQARATTAIGPHKSKQRVQNTDSQVSQCLEHASFIEASLRASRARRLYLWSSPHRRSDQVWTEVGTLAPWHPGTLAKHARAHRMPGGGGAAAVHVLAALPRPRQLGPAG